MSSDRDSTMLWSPGREAHLLTGHIQGEACRYVSARPCDTSKSTRAPIRTEEITW